MAGADLAGSTRQERLRRLAGSFRHQGITVRYDEVPGVGHEGLRLVDAVTAFFDDVLAGIA